jgi:hypothetical protein
MAEINPDVMRTIFRLREAYTKSALVAFIVPKEYSGMFRKSHQQYTHPPGGQLAYTHNREPIALDGLLGHGQNLIGFVRFEDVKEISLIPIMIEIEGEECR